ncbi:S8 family peptidase [bacterium]|nr:S8 family peptidase [bacterium]
MYKGLTIALLLLVCVSAAYSNYIYYPVQPMPLREFSVGCILIGIENEEVLPQLERLNSDNNTTMRVISEKLGIYIVKFEKPYTDEEFYEARDNSDWDRLNSLYELADEQVWSFVDLYEESGLVKWASPNHFYYTQYTPDDPYYRDDGDYTETSDPDQYGDFIMNCAGGWDVTTGDADVLIAILDSGVDLDHPDLMDNIWVNPLEDVDGDGEVYDLDDINGIDDDGNGFIDDLNGYDFVGGVTGHEADMSAVEYQQDWNPDVHSDGDDGWGEPDPSVGDGESTFPILFPADMGVSHGTHVAGISAAVMDNRYQFAGKAGHCKIMAVRIAHPEGGVTGEGDMIQGIEYAADNNANVINLSMGGLFGGEAPGLDAAVEYAYGQGTALICASGNVMLFPAGVTFPASHPNTLAVGSFNSDLGTSSFTEYGPELDVLAAGGEASMVAYSEVIWSTWVASVANEADLDWPAGSHQIKGEVGTSMACPQTAGLAGLIYSVLPDIDPDSLYNIIRNTAQDVGPTGWDEESGYGIVDFEAALRAVGIDEDNTIKPSAKLYPCFPNPFNSETKIFYEIAAPGQVTLEIFDCLGNKVKTLVNQTLSAGKHSATWEGKNDINNSMSSGVYFAKLQNGDKVFNNKLILIK